MIEKADESKMKPIINGLEQKEEPKQEVFPEE